MIKSSEGMMPQYEYIIPQTDFINDDFLSAFDGRDGRNTCVKNVNIALEEQVNLKNKNYLNIRVKINGVEFKDTRIMEPEKQPEIIMDPEKQPERIIEPEKKKKI
jgi:hypothetical protein